MKKTSLLIVYAIAATLSLHAQEMNVIRSNCQIQKFDMTGIDSISFVLCDTVTQAGLCDLARFHTPGGLSLFTVTAIDSMRFTEDQHLLVYRANSPTTFGLSELDSVTFSNSTDYTVSVVYNGSSVTVTNPLASSGVSVTVSGADVIVTAATNISGINYALSGTSADGMFKAYSNRPFVLGLNGVTLTNSDGPAINIQAEDEITVVLGTGTTNSLTDGATYAAAPGSEDQKAAFFSEGVLNFTGSGSLTIHGNGSDQHGLCSDDYVQVNKGTIVVQSAVKDGIHTNDGYRQSGGSVQVTSNSDGIDAGTGPIRITGGGITVTSTQKEKDGIKCTDTLQIAGGTIGLTVQGNSSKGLKAAYVKFTGGTVTIGTSGGVVLAALGSGYDPSYCTAVKGDSLVVLEGCVLTITTTGIAGRGISSDGEIVMNSGTLSVTSSGGGATYTNSSGVADAYHGPCINADRDIVLSGGTVTLSHSGSGGKGISGDGDLTIGTSLSSPMLSITTTGTSISIGSGEYAEAKAISVDSVITVNNGTITISSADDAMKSKYKIDVKGGTMTVSRSVEGFEAPNILISGGDIRITSSDDGLNATYGSDIEGNDGSNLTISGGRVYLNAPSGDGIDSNGDLTISGGTTIVHGPPSQPEVGLDVNGTFLTTGGVLVVAQINSNMIESPSTQSTQRSVLVKANQTITGGMLFHIEDASGNSLVTFAPVRTYSSVLVSLPGITAGTSYKVFTGGSCTGTVQDGLYTGGTCSGGTQRATFTSSSVAQSVTF
jgi:trimeric autotransporter adhesin